MNFKINLVPVLAVEQSGIYLLEEWQSYIKEKSRFVDEMKLVDGVGKFKQHQPFFIHFQWKSNKHNGARGQFQYFRAWNYKFAFERFQ